MKVHQNIFIDGRDWGENKSRLGSKFCNEGKWHNFIKPLLDNIADDPQEMSFLEIGCNAGLFLKMAKDYGFRNVYGIDEMRDAIEVGKMYRDELGYDYKMACSSLHEEYNYSKLPLVDVLLLSNFHYHISIPTFIKLLDAMEYKARYIVLVSDIRGRHARWRPDPEIEPTRLFFKRWKEGNTIYPIGIRGDPHPRRLYSLLYKGNLRRIPLNKIVSRELTHQRRDKVVRDFISRCMEVEHFDIKKMHYYKVLKLMAEKRGHNKDVDKACEDKRNMLRDLKINGIKEPIFIDSEMNLLDGGHRMVALEVLGYKTAIVRII